MRQPDSEFLIRRADVRDAAVICRHRARMFQDMGDLFEETLDDFLAASQAWTERGLDSGEYIGWLASPKDEPGVVIAGAGVQLRQVAPHPHWPTRNGGFAQGRHAIVLNVFTEPEWRNRGAGLLLMKEIIRWAREEKLDRLVLHASPQARPLYERLGFVANNEMRFAETL